MRVKDFKDFTSIRRPWIYLENDPLRFKAFDRYGVHIADPRWSSGNVVRFILLSWLIGYPIVVLQQDEF